MANLPTKSHIQFEHRPDGTVGLVGRPDVVLQVHEDQAHAGFPAWETALELPQFEEQWEALAEGTESSVSVVDSCGSSWPTNHRRSMRAIGPCSRVEFGSHHWPAIL